MDLDKAKEILEDEYVFNEVNIEWFNETKHKNVFKVTTDKGIFVLRIFPEKRLSEQVDRDIAILEFLEEHNFPAHRLVKTKDNKPSITINNRRALLLNYLEGKHPKLNPETMAKIGELMARLHKLGEEHRYPYKSSWSVNQEREVLSNELKKPEIANLPDPESIIPEVRQAFDLLPNLEDLPQVLIHTDMHGNNMIENEKGELFVIDWDDAGMSTAILDLGEVLSQVCIRFEDEQNFTGIHFREDLAQVFLNSYQNIRKLNSKEKENMINAMKFTALAYSIQYWVPAIAIGDWRRFKLEQEQGTSLLANVLYKYAGMGKLPKIIQEVGLDFDWDNKKVWQLKVPVEKMRLSELEWQFDIPFWDIGDKRYVLTPNEVINNKEKYAEEYQRTMNADLTYPIDIMQNRKGLWECLDGLHRVVKAKLLRYEEVNVRKIPPSEIPNIQED